MSAVSAESILNLVREVLSFSGVDNVAKLETLALIASTDLESGEMTIAADDHAALAVAAGQVG